jgi:hypothetical protein
MLATVVALCNARTGLTSPAPYGRRVEEGLRKRAALLVAAFASSASACIFERLSARGS